MNSWCLSAIVALCFIFLSYFVVCNSSELERLDSLSSYSVHLRDKRQITETAEYKSISDANGNSSSATTAADQLHVVPTDANGTVAENIKQAESPGATDIGEQVSTTPAIPVLQQNSTKLVGVNGTGQRKEYTSTPPTIVSDPISVPSKTPKLSTPKKAHSDPKSALEEIIDNIDIAENETRAELAKNNITYKDDYHIYYNSSMVVDEHLTNEYWESFKNITVSTMLSQSHRRAMTVQLTFDFPFYGHPVRNVTVATGGFLYTGEYVHSWLAATQYIAPLMANFDTSLSKNSLVRYADNGTAFTVIWENVALQDKQEVGSFTFSATLHNNGDIVFTYFSVPMPIEAIEDDKHPVKVGLSDAYIIDKVIFFARRKTIYEYHRVNFGSQDIKNATIIFLHAQPTCLSFTDCTTCLQHDTKFTCTWCSTLEKCSTGTDRKRQEWLHKGCDKTQITNVSLCPPIGHKGNNAGQEGQDSSESDMAYRKDSLQEQFPEKSVISYEKNMEPSRKEEKSNVGLVLGLMLPICLIMSILVWILYAYRNPHTKSGQLLIQYRPSQWTWRRGEARYTAATIHM